MDGDTLEVGWRIGGRCLLNVGILSEFLLNNGTIKDLWLEILREEVKEEIETVKIFYRIILDSNFSLVPIFANINKVYKIKLDLLILLSL